MPEWYTLDDVADRLGLHVRTVRGYVRDGRLGAVRIGKQYRVSRADLEALTGGPADERGRHVDVTSVIDVDGIDGVVADRLAQFVRGLPTGRGALHVDVVHERDRERMKIIVVGPVTESAELLRLVGAMVQEPA